MIATDIELVVPIGHGLGAFPDHGRIVFEVRRRADIEELTQAEAAAWTLSPAQPPARACSL